jgi:hypothetical protein
MNTFENANYIAEWKLERYLLGELSPEEMEIIRINIEQNPSLKLRVEALEKSNRDILERYPTTSMSRQILNRIAQTQPAGAEKRGTRLSGFWPLPALPVAAILILFVFLPTLLDRGDVDQIGIGQVEITRIKGLDPQLILFRKTESGSERLEEYTPVSEHDLILIKYLPAGRAYGLIFSIDGRGTITRHFPDKGRLAEPLKKDGPVSLDFSYELDDAPDGEKFYFITSDSLFETETVFRAAKIAAIDFTGTEVRSLELPEHLEEHTFTIRKVENDE